MTESASTELAHKTISGNGGVRGDFEPQDNIEPSNSSTTEHSENASHSTAAQVPEIDYEEVAVVAFGCWHQRGCPHGSPEVDWEEAQRIVRSRDSKSSVASA